MAQKPVANIATPRLKNTQEAISKAREGKGEIVGFAAFRYLRKAR